MTRIQRAAQQKRAIKVAEILKICAHPYRLIILCLLEHKPWSVGAIAAEINLSQPAVSQHLARLRKVNIVVAIRHANRIHYQLNGNQSVELNAVISVFCRKLLAKTLRASSRLPAF
jgi:DNA-binding transcriptional ArsR family regulator